MRIPEHSATYSSDIRPPLTRCFEAHVFSVSWRAFRQRSWFWSFAWHCFDGVEIEALGEIGGVVRKLHCFAMVAAALGRAEIRIEGLSGGDNRRRAGRAFKKNCEIREAPERRHELWRWPFAFFGGVPLSGALRQHHDGTWHARGRQAGAPPSQRVDPRGRIHPAMARPNLHEDIVALTHQHRTFSELQSMGSNLTRMVLIPTASHAVPREEDRSSAVLARAMQGCCASKAQSVMLNARRNFRFVPGGSCETYRRARDVTVGRELRSSPRSARPRLRAAASMSRNIERHDAGQWMPRALRHGFDVNLTRPAVEEQCLKRQAGRQVLRTTSIASV